MCSPIVDRPTERPIELLVAAKNVSQKYGVAKVYIINLDITVNYFIFLHCLSSKGEIRHSIQRVNASSVAVAGCRSKVCVLRSEQDK